MSYQLGRRWITNRRRTLTCKRPIEVDAYFGEELRPCGKCESFVDWCDWVFETYQHTPHDKLLEFIANAKGIQHFRTGRECGLAIAGSDRMASALHQWKGLAHSTENVFRERSG